MGLVSPSRFTLNFTLAPKPYSSIVIGIEETGKMNSSNNRIFVLMVSIVILTANAVAMEIDQGSVYYQQGEYDKAAEEWYGPAEKGDVVAQHNMGVLSLDGLGSTPRDQNKAALWFLRSAQQGYVPAMVSLAEVQTSMGQDKVAQSWLTLAARWGSKEAVELLESKGLSVPKPDLYADAIGRQQLENMRETGVLMRPPIREISAERVVDDG